MCPTDRTLSGATTLGQIEPGSNGNEGVLCILKAPALLEPHNHFYEGFPDEHFQTDKMVYSFSLFSESL